MTTGLLAGTTNTRNGIESRRPVYLLLGVGEALLIPVLVLEALKNGNRDAAFTRLAALCSIACLVPGLVWRSYVMCVRPDLLGKYEERIEGGAGASGTKCK